jgi:hypothetical protein
MPSKITLQRQLGQLNGLEYAQKFQLEDHRAQMESDILQYGLTSANAGGSVIQYVHANP